MIRALFLSAGLVIAAAAASSVQDSQRIPRERPNFLAAVEAAVGDPVDAWTVGLAAALREGAPTELREIPSS